MRALSILTILLLVSSPVLAGSSADPEVVDPSGDFGHDFAESGGGCALPGQGDGASLDMSAVDITAAWINTTNLTTFSVYVQTVGVPDGATTTSIEFAVNATESSVFNSTATGTTHGASATGATLATGPSSTVVSQNTNVLNFTFLRADVGASGGDAIIDLVVTTSRSEDDVKSALCTETETGTDLAPNTGASRAFNLSRPPVVAEALVQFVDGQVSETDNGTTATRALSQAEATTLDTNASASFRYNLTNTGTDLDSFALSIVNLAGLADNEATATLSLANVSLAPGASQMFWLNVTLDDAAPADYSPLALVESTRGAASIASAKLTLSAPVVPPVDTPPGNNNGGGTDEEPSERKSVVGGLGWLTGPAEAIGFDEQFNDWAEVVLLAIIILLVLLILFLVLMLAPRSIVTVKITPSTIRAAPGETAEFNVSVRNKKRKFRDAAASFDGDASWTTGLLLQPDEGAALHPLTKPGQNARMALSARREPGDHVSGRLRVQVPQTAGHRETDRITLNINPVGADGNPISKGRGKATVSVVSDDPAGLAKGAAGSISSSSGSPIRLAKVVHAPMAPVAGEQVVTTITIENDAPQKEWHLTVALTVDDEIVSETPVVMPPRSGRAVKLPWRAGVGANNVRVQIFQREGPKDE